MKVHAFSYFSVDDPVDMQFDCPICWSRIYEYPFVISHLRGSVHNTSWGYEGIHVVFRDWLDANVAELRRTLSKAKDADFDGTWSVRSGADVYDTAGRLDALRNTINHFVHHRGQLTVYLRLNEVPLPSVYGPSADDRRF